MINPKISSSLPDQGVPASLLTVAAHTPKEVPVRIIDEGIETIDFNKMKDALVGITVMTCGAPRAKEIAEEAIRAGAYGVITGGIHSTVCTQEMAQYGAVLKGEIEGGSWSSVVSDYMSGRPVAKGQIYYSDKVRLENLPLARKEIYDYARRLSSQQISHARGCPMFPPCDFCTVGIVGGIGVRNRPLEEVIAELETRGLLECDENLLTFFTTDSFGILPGDLQLLRRIQDKLNGRYMEWFAQVNIRTLNNDHFLELANSFGFVTLFVGLESSYTKELASVKRGGVDKIDPVKVFEKVKKYPNIRTLAGLMVGFDFEPADVFEETYKFVLRLQPSGVYYSILTPLPGSAIADKLEAENRIVERDWGLFNTRNLVYKARYKKPDGGYGQWNHQAFMDGYNRLVQETAQAMKSWPTLKVPVR